MIKEIYTAALGMQSQITRLEVISNNIANSSTAGYKRASVFERNLIEVQNNFNFIPTDVEQKDPPTGSYFDFSNGAAENTNNPLDLLISGNGFFTLMDEDGNYFLTRAGNFQISDDGYIVSMDDKKLIGSDGPISLNKDIFARQSISGDTINNTISVAPTGEIFVNNNEIAKLSIVIPENFDALERASNSQFTIDEETTLIQINGDKLNIRQGWLEGSNVNIINEMVQMIELQRMYDAGSKVIQTNDGTLEKSINMGRFF